MKSLYKKPSLAGLALNIVSADRIGQASIEGCRLCREARFPVLLDQAAYPTRSARTTHMSVVIETDRHLFRFAVNAAEGNATMAKELGGKGAALQEMSRLGIPVPPGFTVPTEACRTVLRDGKPPAWFDGEVSGALCWLERQQGKVFGGETNPLLVSVRSGAAISMPGMMDTILNIGLNDTNVYALADRHGSLRFALDSYRRLLQMFGSVVLDVPKTAFDSVLHQIKNQAGAHTDSVLDESTLESVIARFKAVIEGHTGEPFPADCRQQLDLAVAAVFSSWNTARAQHYRRIHHLDEQAGTAVTIQAMVFGNSGNDSGTGVGFTRNPSTGESNIFGEFLLNAQGEDIVAGTHTPVPLSQLGRTMPRLYDELKSIVARLEIHYRDVQDFEFTVERGKLFLLQTRSAKRSAIAAVRAAVEMAEEGLISESEAILRIDPSSIHELLSQQLDLAGLASQPIARGVAASPGSAVGRLVFSADRAVALTGKRKEQPVILVREETSADDIHGMDAAVGFVTVHGGATSHAAVVARGMGKCCITGADSLRIDQVRGVLRVGRFELKEGDWLSIDGATGRIFAGQLPLKPGQSDCPWLKKLLAWSRYRIGSSVRANADTPDDAERARDFDASGIGLCRTEHMFFAPERLPNVHAMILAEDGQARKTALDKLLPMQQQDFEEIFHVMAGLPVTIRLIDPPLHEFLPSLEEVRTALSEARKHDTTQVRELEHVIARIGQLSETNPMMGHRGCRLGITYPEIIAMQTRAILRAAIVVQAEGIPVEPEIMIPLVSLVEEIRFLRKVIVATAEEVFAEEQESVTYRLGTMIELPRAAVCAGAIAREVDFLSFGTNDLTQMTFGFSRDDTRKYLDQYLELGILKDDPFLVLDQEGVGQLMQVAILNARQSNPSITIGVCGEHGGDPRSIEFFHSLGVDYVSASPARIPVAQLALAQAHLKLAPESDVHSFLPAIAQENDQAAPEIVNA